MIFNNSTSTFESEKERNLYYKVFAGYLLNELIPGYSERLQSFCSIVNDSEERGRRAPQSVLKLDPAYTHVSFDNHLYLFSEIKTDRGEFADILIHDKSNKTIVAIEAKLHSNWSYDKDIESNQRRLNLIKSSLPSVHLFPILLVSRFRWNQAKKKESNLHSNYMRFREEINCQYITILWEQLSNIIINENVRRFLDSQLERYNEGFSYQFDQNWFSQEPQG